MIFQGPASPTQSRFLKEYWQKKPCLLRQAFPGYVPELQENDIAGLACDETSQSRLVSGSYPQNDWQVKYGPFSARELRNLPGSNWCLLVQDVEKHYPPIASILENFDFLPTWRLDDLMVSVAAKGGTVGPHFDQYDVFLLQVSGRHRWQIAWHFDPAPVPECDLHVMKSFTAEAEWCLEPGDVLYLPPGVGHYGVALEKSMTWSIGLRAPNQADLLQALGEWLAERDGGGERYADGKLFAKPRPGEISARAIKRLHDLMDHALRSSREINSFLASFLTRYRLAQLPAPPVRALNEHEVAVALAGSSSLQRNPWTRMAWVEQDGMALLFAAGDEYVCGIEIAQQLCANPVQLPGNVPFDEATLSFLCRLINDGHLFFAHSGDAVTGETVL